MSAADHRVGWCPGALRPMRTGDGLIVRVKPRGGRLALEQARRIAELSQGLGNGALELTARANLQIRGVTDATLPVLVAELDTLGLIDPSAEVEAIRNIVASPLAGCDPTALVDIRPVVAAIERRLESDADLLGLPAKWSILVDDGGWTSLAAIESDIRFEAEPCGVFRVGIGQATMRAHCLPGAAPAVVAALSRLATGRSPRRMAALVEERGAARVFAAAGLVPAERSPARDPGTTARDVVGCHRINALTVFGAAAPFGALAATDLRAFAEAAIAGGALDVRLTPWRTLLAVGVESEEPFAGLDLITDAGDKRLAIAACPGQDGCHRGTTPVRDHARALAAMSGPMDAGIAIHVSGCVKGCAHGQPAPLTLVARDGCYDVVRHGKADGRPVARGLSFQAAATWLSRSADEGWA